MYPSNFRKKISGSGVALGTSLPSPEPSIAVQTYSCGPDWTWVDTEHCPWDMGMLYTSLVMGRMSGVAPVVRVPWNTPAEIKRAYDAGAVGVMVPQVDNPEEAADAVRYAKYPPMGERGLAPWFAQFVGASGPQVVEHANNETVLALQMESAEAWEKIDDTLKVEGFELLIVGPADLSMSYGGKGDVHFGKVENIMTDVVVKVKRAGKALGSTFADPEDCRRWIEAGYNVMNVSSPMALGTVTLKKIFAELREEFGVATG